MNWGITESIVSSVEGLAAFILFGLNCAAAYLLAARALPSAAGTSTRCAAAFLIMCWGLIVTFYALHLVAGFRLEVIIPLELFGVALTCASSRKDPTWKQRAGGDWNRLLDLVRSWRQQPALAVAFASFALLALVRTARGSVAPPLGWNALLYHLPKSARWVQTHQWASFVAPDSLRYYEHFSPGGDILQAWAMLITRSDMLIAAWGLVCWVAAGLSAYVAARAFQASRVTAAWAGLTLATTPAVLNLMTTGYVDTPVLIFALLAVAFLARGLLAPNRTDFVLCAAALGLAVATKISSMAMLPLAGLLALWRIGGHRAWTWRYRVSIVAAMVVAIAIGVVPLLRAWAQTGSPFYPWWFHLAGVSVEGNSQLQQFFSGELFRITPGMDKPHQLFFTLFYGRVLFSQSDFLGLGAAGPLFFLASAWGTFRGLRLPPPQRWAVLFALSVLVTTVFGFLFSPDLLTHRTLWAGIAGRLILPALGCAVILTTLVPTRISTMLFVIAAAANFACGLPGGFCEPDGSALSALFIGLVPVVVLATGTAWFLRRRPRFAVMAGVLITLTGIALVLPRVRASFRHQYYAAVRTHGCPYDGMALRRSDLAGAPLWEKLDDGVARRMAIASGWNGDGVNWFYYPAAGAKLVSQLNYVPITADGSVIDYQQQALVQRDADLRSWISRLDREQIDVLITSFPEPIETIWARSLPTVFAPLFSGPKIEAFSVNRDAARAFMESSE